MTHVHYPNFSLLDFTLGYVFDTSINQSRESKFNTFSCLPFMCPLVKLLQSRMSIQPHFYSIWLSLVMPLYFLGFVFGGFCSNKPSSSKCDSLCKACIVLYFYMYIFSFRTYIVLALHCCFNDDLGSMN